MILLLAILLSLCTSVTYQTYSFPYVTTHLIKSFLHLGFQSYEAQYHPSDHLLQRIEQWARSVLISESLDYFGEFTLFWCTFKGPYDADVYQNIRYDQNLPLDSWRHFACFLCVTFNFVTISGFCFRANTLPYFHFFGNRPAENLVESLSLGNW